MTISVTLPMARAESEDYFLPESQVPAFAEWWLNREVIRRPLRTNTRCSLLALSQNEVELISGEQDETDVVLKFRFDTFYVQLEDGRVLTAIPTELTMYNLTGVMAPLVGKPIDLVLALDKKSYIPATGEHPLAGLLTFGNYIRLRTTAVLDLHPASGDFQLITRDAIWVGFHHGHDKQVAYEGIAELMCNLTGEAKIIGVDITVVRGTGSA